MTTPTPEALAELRRLLDAANHARDIYEVNEDDSRGYSVETWDGWSIATCSGEQWAQLIAAAVNALPSLLNAAAELDALAAWPEPACLLHDVSGEDVRGWEMAECTCPTRPLTAAGITPLPMGLCGNREDHEPHLVPYAPVANGPMWCTADQSKREPYASERRRDEAGTGGAEPS